MNDTDNEASPSKSGYLTPPFSPTKTASTEDWASPRTPASPRKSRSCLFFRDIDSTTNNPYLTSPSSFSAKPKLIAHLEALSVPDRSLTNRESILAQFGDITPAQQEETGNDQPRLFHPSTLARFHTRSSPVTGARSLGGEVSLWTDSNPLWNAPPPCKRRCSNRRSSDSIPESLDCTPSPFQSPTITVVADESPSLPRLCYTNTSTMETPSPSKLRQFPIRYANSPLRPSQWVARGGLLATPRQSQTSTPDRFIAGRRPPTVARESFELSNPMERRNKEKMTGRGTRTNSDAFSRRLRRSGRIDDELRGLREANSVISGRTNAYRRNSNFRHRPIALSARQISTGAVWNVGGPSAVSDTVVGVSTGRGRMLGSGTNAPLYKSAFLNRADPEAELEAYERRLALALDADQTDRIFQHSSSLAPQSTPHGGQVSQPRHTWRDGAWVKDVLDAPNLRDDYYCTLLAYSFTSKCLAVGLGNFVHLWSERSGVNTPESLNSVLANGSPDVQHVTSLDFSSALGGQAILAVGRADGRISLWSPFDSEPRFDATQPKPVSCVSWRPTVVQRPSLRDKALTVPTEELLIGDEVGHIYFYSVEWPSETQSALFGWHGAMTLLARLKIHSQQICGLAWSSTGELFASGGNDNNCNLFETKKVLHPNNSGENGTAVLDVREGPRGESIYTVSNRANDHVLHLAQSAAKHTWTLNAAVKAMAFCPWQRGLIAIGGGSNDRCIHFYHTRSGTCLATIDCAAQVTSLIWSRTRREIAATFGFAQPEHPYRVAVFAWPSCEQVVAVPWYDENRALCAVAYPGGPTKGPHNTNEERDGGRARGEDGVWSQRGVEEGCIVVAASDMAIRFHEIWSDRSGSVGLGLLGSGTVGLLGGSDILEGPYAGGIERQGAVIR
ncbi:WD domain-containing [Pyrenophora seminiperda CCB06]|uniref:WD domain-containing n=1 Tax=Pyrenophora seminiperda CCB06 TaxID=1302712 RepID=A0A3M7MIJ5_9PLEO|nr:WD domain-containing [Pyrenophora seminiperda CCB06]